MLWLSVAVVIGLAIIFLLITYCHYGITSLSELTLELGILRSTISFILLQVRMKAHNKTYMTFWKEAVQRFKDKPLLTDENGTVTFGRADEMSTGLAKFLYERGIREHNTVAIFMTNSSELLVAWLATVKIGAKPALVNTNLRGASLMHCITSLKKLSLVLVNREAEKNLYESLNHHQLSLMKLPVVTVDLQSETTKNNNFSLKTLNLMSIIATEFDELYNLNLFESKTRYNKTVGFIFTSGTTGYPKPVPVAFHRVWALLSVAIVTRYKIKSDDVIYSPLPLYHSTAFHLGLHTAILSGCCMVVRRKLSIQEYWNDVGRSGATIILYVGEMCRFLLSRRELHRPTITYPVRLALGNGLSPDVYDDFKSSFRIPTIEEFYSQTEGYGFLGSVLQKPGSFGYVPKIKTGPFYPYRVIQCDVVTLEPLRHFTTGLCKLCEVNQPGLLVVNAAKFPSVPPEVAPTCHHDVLRVGDKFISTGDLMYIAEDRTYHFVDRLGDTYRWKSENVSTTEVHGVVIQCPGVVEACVYGVPVPGYGGKCGMIAMVADKAGGFSFSELYLNLIKNLPRYAVPIFIRKVGTLDLTETFKYKTAALKARGFSLNENGLVLIVDHANSTFSPLTPDKLEDIRNMRVKL